MFRIPIQCIFILLALSDNIIAQESSSWLPITEKDWEVGKDSSKGIFEAVMLFEKLAADESELVDEECYLRVYRRIKILNTRGENWADVSLPYDAKKEKIKKIMGRTILPDGAIYELKKEHILEKEIVKTEGVKVKQKFFSLPGVTDSCIIEYIYEYETTTPNAIWIAQKEIPVLHWEYRWKFQKSENRRIGFTNIFLILLYGGGTAPNYLWYNSTKQLTIEQIPSPENPDEVIFSVNDLPSFDADPYSLSDEALKAQLRLYYGSPMSPSYYWSSISNMIQEEINNFMDAPRILKKITAQFSSLTSDSEKIAAVYRWLQSNIKNVTYASSGEEFKENESVDDVISRGYGTQQEINFLFHFLLKELGINSFLVFVTDKDKEIFLMDAKYWQFHRSLVGIIDSLNQITYSSPGDVGTSMKQVPWNCEGQSALYVGVQTGEMIFRDIPVSPSDKNVYTQIIKLDVDTNLNVQGSATRIYSWHYARTVRLDLHDMSRQEQEEFLKNNFRDSLAKGWCDSLKMNNFAEQNDTVTASFTFRGLRLEEEANGNIYFKPFSMFPNIENPFLSETRIHPILFDYAFQTNQIINFIIPQTINIESIPDEFKFSNLFGKLEAKTTRTGDTIRVDTKFILNYPRFTPSMYEAVRKLFQERQRFNDITVILKKKK